MEVKSRSRIGQSINHFTNSGTKKHPLLYLVVAIVLKLDLEVEKTHYSH